MHIRCMPIGGVVGIMDYSRVPVHPGELVGMLESAGGGCGSFRRHRRAENGVVVVGHRGLHAERIEERRNGTSAAAAAAPPIVDGTGANSSQVVSVGRRRQGHTAVSGGVSAAAVPMKPLCRRKDRER